MARPKDRPTRALHIETFPVEQNGALLRLSPRFAASPGRALACHWGLGLAVSPIVRGLPALFARPISRVCGGISNMFGKSAIVIALASALVVPALYGCQASFHAGSEPATAPTPAPPPPPPPAETAAPAPAPAPAPSAVVVKGDSVQIPGQIEFDTGEATFKPGGGSDAVVDQLKIFLDQNPKVTKLRIEGHTDNVGTPDTNQTLSGQRALTVKNAAIAKGVKKERFLAVGFGQNEPIADNTTEEGRAQNRRTEFRFAEIGGKKYLGLDPTGGGKVFE